MPAKTSLRITGHTTHHDYTQGVVNNLGLTILLTILAQQPGVCPKNPLLDQPIIYVIISPVDTASWPHKEIRNGKQGS